MKRPVKLLLWTALAVVAVGSIVLTSIVTLIDPNDFKPLIVRTVYEKKLRTLNFEGPIKLRVFPRIALDLGRITLSEYRSGEVFMATDQAELEVAWLPLLRKRLVVEGIRLDGVSARVIRYANGTFNFADLMQQETPSQIDFDISTLRALNSTVIFEDRKSARTYTARKLTLRTGRLVNGRETAATLSGELIASQPLLALGFDARTQLTFDTRARRYQVRALELNARGNALNFTNVILRMGGDAMFERTGKRGENTQFVADGKRGAWRTHAEVTIPSWATANGGASAENPRLALRFERDQTRIGLEAKSERVSQQDAAWTAADAACILTGQLGGTALRGQFNGPLTIDKETRRVELPDLRGTLGVAGQRWRSGGFKANLQGRMTFAPREKAPFTALLDASAHTTRAHLDFAIDRLTPLHSTFKAELDKLELDRFLSRKRSREVSKGGAIKIPQLNSDGDVIIGEFSHGTTRAQGVRIEIRDD